MSTTHAPPPPPPPPGTTRPGPPQPGTTTGGGRPRIPLGPPLGTPPRRSPRWLWAGSVLAALMLLGLGYQHLGTIAREQVTDVRVVDATGLTQIHVRTSAGRVEVVGADVDTVTVHATIDHGLRPSQDDQRIVGDRLELRASCPILSWAWCSVDYRIEVPRSLDVTIRSTFDRVEVAGLDGTVDVRSSNGSVDAVDLAGWATLGATNGSVRGEGLTASSVEVRSTNGSVRLHFATEPDAVVARTVNGSVEVVVPPTERTYALDVSTVNGPTEATVRADPTSEFPIEARSINGTVRVRYGP